MMSALCNSSTSCPQAREAGHALAQDVDSLAARVADSAPSSLDSAHCLTKEVGLLSDVGAPPTVHCTLQHYTLGCV